MGHSKMLPLVSDLFIFDGYQAGEENLKKHICVKQIADVDYLDVFF